MQTGGDCSSDISPVHRLLAAPAGLRTQVLLNLRDVDGTPERIAELLGEPIETIRKIFSDLEAAGLICRDVRRDGIERWIPMIGNLDVRDREGDVSVQCFHWRSLEEAIRRIGTDPSSRNYQAVIFPLSPQEYDELRNEVTAFRKKLMDRYSRTNGSGRCLYQVNFNVVPVSEEL